MNQENRAFTLIEVLVVAALLALLVAKLVPSLKLRSSMSTRTFGRSPLRWMRTV